MLTNGLSLSARFPKSSNYHKIVDAFSDEISGRMSFYIFLIIWLSEYLLLRIYYTCIEGNV